MGTALVQAAITLCKANLNRWTNEVLTNRAGEINQVSPYLGTDRTASAVTEILDAAVKRLEEINARPRISRSLPDEKIQRVVMAASTLDKCIGKYGNGIPWLFHSGNLGLCLVALELSLAALDRDSKSEQNGILDAAHRRLAEDLHALQRAADYSEQVSSRAPAIDAAIERIRDCDATIEQQIAAVGDRSRLAEKSIKDAQDEILEIGSKARTTIDENTQKLEQRIDEERDNLTKARAIYKSMERVESAFQRAHTDAASAVEKAQKALAEARDAELDASARLAAALRDVQREGLAGSFTRKADAVNRELQDERGQFHRALLYLSVVAVGTLVFEAVVGPSANLEQFILRFARAMALATPGIWIAWMASRRIGALNRVLTDYEYKSATALAYESYRKEVDAAGNDSLRQHLLATAIRTLGENPTRYYDSAREEAAAPIESWLQKVSVFGKKDTEQAASRS